MPSAVSSWTTVPGRTGLSCVSSVILLPIWACLSGKSSKPMRQLLSASPHIRVQPVIVRFKTDLKTKTARVLLANSITLTPGTITVALQDNEYTVHCLDRRFSEGLSDSVFVRLLHKIEGQVAG